MPIFRRLRPLAPPLALLASLTGPAWSQSLGIPLPPPEPSSSPVSVDAEDAPPGSAADFVEDGAADPYLVFVAQAEAFTRCGPSGDYYRTDRLRHGQQLDVYVETADGWLGIRPPDDSFSWVVADAIELDRSGERGTVIEDRTVSWIGTHLGRARRYRWQVQLAEGETVTVLGRSERDGPDGPQLWYRIVPPSGEFRWVHRDQVVQSPEELVAAATPAPDDSLEFLPADRARDRRDPPPDRVAGRGGDSASGRSREMSEEGPAAARPETETRLPEPAVVTAGVDADRDWSGDGTDDQPIGSGLRRSWQSGSAPEDRSAFKESSPAAEASVATAEFLTRPRLRDIGQGSGSSGLAPSGAETPGDGNWVDGGVREDRFARSPVVGGVRPVSGEGMPVHSLGVDTEQSPSPLQAASAPLLRSLKTVSAERIAEIEHRAQDASVDDLQLILSRLMAERVSSAEVEPVREAAQRLAERTADEVLAGRSRLLAERAEQYQRIARRRDGDTVVRSERAPRLPTPRSLPAASFDTTGSQAVQREAFAGTAEGRIAAGTDSTEPPDRSTAEVAGTLVAVYSARPQSPPYALTDRTGETTAYVTPAPGVDLRPHLNSRIRVSGRQGYLPGINTPHLIVSAVERTRE